MSDAICKWDKGWGIRCRAPVEERGLCRLHAAKVCCVCGEPATHACPEVVGPLVCGRPLCDEHATCGGHGAGDAR